MEYFDEDPQPMSLFLISKEAEKACGLVWRRPEAAEFEELAWFIAEEAVRGVESYYEMGTDEAEILSHIESEKGRVWKELQSLTMVMDFKKLDTCVYYTYLLVISKRQRTGSLHFEDNLCRYIKQNGVLRVLDRDQDFLFEI